MPGETFIVIDVPLIQKLSSIILYFCAYFRLIVYNECNCDGSTHLDNCKIIKLFKEYHSLKIV